MLTKLKKMIKLVIVVIIILGLTYSFLNFVSIDSHAFQRGTEGTKVYHSDGSYDCQGEPYDC